MDQSLRTVATQLLNVSGPDDTQTQETTKTDKLESKLGLLIRKPEPANRDIPPRRENFNDNSNVEIGSVNTMAYGRFGNSKYNYFEASHPGQAMAMTEEELEKELSASKHTTAYKPKHTTTGGISTWILLNPPSTTLKPVEEISNNNNEQQLIQSIWKPTKPTPSTVKIDTTLRADLKATSLKKGPTIQTSTSKSITSSKQNPTTSKTTTEIDTQTTPKLVTTESIKSEVSRITTKSSTARNDDDNESTTLKTTTKRIIAPTRTSRPSITTPNTTTVVTKTTTIKVIRPSRPSKPAVLRKPTKPEAAKLTNVTSKIEKVTFRPVQMIAKSKNPAQQSPPMFVAKIKASLQTDPVTPKISITSILKKDDSKNFTTTERSTTSTKTKPKPNILKVQLKKPVDSVTTIEIQPIKVNAPILTIERVEDAKQDNLNNADKPIALDDSKIDVKFDFNPELTKIIETSTETTTTTKKPKHKRKKNKIRRRKPSSTTETPAISLATPEIITSNEVTDTIDTDVSFQESKIVPDTQVSSNGTKNKKKQPIKPFSTQIYNFLSREVMPSFGVMSLVGLGLGLASYFLYPFGGTIARRNGYEVEPNFKYNPEEYGGNYGQSEEEVFSKVLQGMTTADSKYGGMKDYENNYYRYQAYDGAYTDPYTTRRNDIRYPTSSVPVYRPDNTPLPYDSKYRNTDFKYPDLVTTPGYYERQTQEFLNAGGADRQFVVGNIPKEYSHDDKKLPLLSTTTEAMQTDFEKHIAQSLKFVENPVNISPNFGHAEAQALKQINDGYEDIEFTPTAVAVEHGPRSLELAKLVPATVKTRRKRDSVIQLIPPRSEIEKIEAEEDLSNEILDIIDSAIPTKDPLNIKHSKRDQPGEGEEKVAMVVPVENVTVTNDKITQKSNEMSTEAIVVKDSNTSSFTTQKLPAEEITSAPELNLNELEGITTSSTTTNKPPQNFNLFDFVRKLAEIKFRVGLTVLKHASEGFAKYLGNVQKKLNGEE